MLLTLLHLSLLLLHGTLKMGAAFPKMKRGCSLDLAFEVHILLNVAFHNSNLLPFNH
jgi:hypothetical protein